MTEYLPRPASDETFLLGEGPVWDVAGSRFLWLDILRGHVLEGVLADGRVEVSARHDMGEMVGAVAPGPDGRLLVAVQEELVVLSPDGSRARGPRVVPAGTASRTNDGGVDPAGRFLVGTMALDERVGRERLVRWDGDGTLVVLDDDLLCSNGLAWSPDGTVLYSVDTIPRIVWRRSYDPDSGAVGIRTPHLRLGDGLPDGICVDAGGNLWVAVWGAGEVRRYAPDGRHLDTVRVPAPHTSSVALVGPHLDLLLVTTARSGLDPAQLEAHPDSGRLFSVTVDTPGIPGTPWRWPAPATR